MTTLFTDFNAASTTTDLLVNLAVMPKLKLSQTAPSAADMTAMDAFETNAGWTPAAVAKAHAVRAAQHTVWVGQNGISVGPSPVDEVVGGGWDTSALKALQYTPETLESFLGGSTTGLIQDNKFIQTLSAGGSAVAIAQTATVADAATLLDRLVGFALPVGTVTLIPLTGTGDPRGWASSYTEGFVGSDPTNFHIVVAVGGTVSVSGLSDRSAGFVIHWAGAAPPGYSGCKGLAFTGIFHQQVQATTNGGVLANVAVATWDIAPRPWLESVYMASDMINAGLMINGVTLSATPNFTGWLSGTQGGLTNTAYQTVLELYGTKVLGRTDTTVTAIPAGATPFLTPSYHSNGPASHGCYAYLAYVYGGPDFVRQFHLVGPITPSAVGPWSIATEYLCLEWNSADLNGLPRATEQTKVAPNQTIRSMIFANSEAVPANPMANLISYQQAARAGQDLGAQVLFPAATNFAAVTFAAANAKASGARFTSLHQVVVPPVQVGIRTIVLTDGATNTVAVAAAYDSNHVALTATPGAIARAYMSGAAVVNNCTVLTLSQAVQSAVLTSSAYADIQSTGVSTEAALELDEGRMFGGHLPIPSNLPLNRQSGFGLIQFGRERSAMNQFIVAACLSGKAFINRVST